MNPTTLPFTKRPAARGTTRRFIPISILQETPLKESSDVSCPEASYCFWMDHIATQPDYEPEKESFCVICLNSKLTPYAWHRVSLGTLNETLAHPREVMRPVILAAASAFVIMHNHPSGDPTPSSADTALTRRIRECTELFRIPMMDHVIIGQPAPGRTPYYSFREAGLV